MKAKTHLFTPAEPDFVQAWRKQHSSELNRLMDKYKDTVYVNNAVVMEIKPKKVKRTTAQQQHFDWVNV